MKIFECPLPGNFFARLGKRHTSEIRREIHKAWKMNGKQLYPELRRRLRESGFLKAHSASTLEWKGAFRYAKEWNRYRGQKYDRAQFQKDIDQGIWKVRKGTLEIDEPTWLTLASLSFARDAEKESPNHLFLKELFKLYAYRVFSECQIREEVYLNVYGEKVRADVVCTAIKTVHDRHVGTIRMIAEIGGVQLWKIIGFLNLGYQVMIIPHWTKQKINPFIRKKLSYDYYIFSPSGGEVAK